MLDLETLELSETAWLADHADEGNWLPTGNRAANRRSKESCSAEAIAEITVAPFAGGVPLGTFTFTRTDAPPQSFRRGDTNADNMKNLADAVFLLAYLFQAGTTPGCLKAGDVNDDGVIDAEDALDASIETVKSAGHSLKSVRNANRDGMLTSDEILELVALLNHVSRQWTITQRVLVELAEQQRRRKLKLAK